MANRRITLMRPSQMFDSFMDEFFNAPAFRGSVSNVNVNMYEDENDVTVEIVAPGFSKDDLEIHVEGDSMTIAGSIKEENNDEDEKRKYYMREYKEESFKRMISLPSAVNAEEAKADVKDGKLIVTLPKRPETKAKKIEISA